MAPPVVVRSDAMTLGTTGPTVRGAVDYHLASLGVSGGTGPAVRLGIGDGHGGQSGASFAIVGSD